jgi:hypothetical protein
VTTPLSTTCSNGHQSNDPDWCDTCGVPMSGSSGSGSSGSGSSASGSSGSGSSGSGSTASATGGTIACPTCGDTNPASNLFCESCGTDFVTGQKPPEPSPQIVAATPAADPGIDLGWSALSTVDSEWFAAKGEGIGTPPDRGALTIELRHGSVVIGRTRSSGNSPGLVVDDDHGISRRHAELTHDANANSWAVTDLGSTNGTFVLPPGEALTAELTPITPNTPRLLVAGDRVFVGAWTRIELTEIDPDQPAAPPPASVPV